VVERFVRAQVATILACLPSPAAARTLVALLSEHDPVLRHALDQAMPYASPEVYDGMQEAIAHSSEHVRHRATELMALGGTTAITRAEASLMSANPRVRAAAARALGILRHRDAKEALVILLRDSDAAVRVAAARALGLIRDISVAPTLIALLPTADVDLRTAIAGSLAELHDPAAVGTLVLLLRDSDANVRLAAASALGTIRDERATRALREHQADVSPVVQATVATALRRHTAV
jgi:HEAT repeat protein